MTEGTVENKHHPKRPGKSSEKANQKPPSSENKSSEPEIACVSSLMQARANGLAKPKQSPEVKQLAAKEYKVYTDFEKSV